MALWLIKGLLLWLRLKFGYPALYYELGRPSMDMRSGGVFRQIKQYGNKLPSDVAVIHRISLYSYCVGGALGFPFMVCLLVRFYLNSTQ